MRVALATGGASGLGLATAKRFAGDGMASVAGQFGAIRSNPAYSASKGAVLAMMKVAAREAAPLGMTVNALAPTGATIDVNGGIQMR